MVKTTLQINGMACGMCESHVNEAIRNAFKVKKVNSSHSKNETVIISEEDCGTLRGRKIKSAKLSSQPDMNWYPYQVKRM